METGMSGTASRRAVLGAALGGAALGGAAAAGLPDLARAETGGHRAGPPMVTSDELRFTPGRTLRTGRPRQVGLAPETIRAMPDDAARYLGTTPQNPDHPMYAGATVLAAKDGVIVQHAAVGKAVRYGMDAAGTTVVELPESEQIPARLDTLWDMASISKMFTATSTAQLIERGVVDLHATVATYLPDFAANGKADITVRNLLTHTSGLIPDPIPSLWKGYDTYDERVAAILATTPSDPPDTVYVYSDLNFMTLGLLIQAMTGQRLDEYVYEHVTGPLGMHDTMYNPPEGLRHRVAAEEYEPWAGRGMVWGSVHDENAWALDGVAGHAGVFSTTGDMARLAQAYLNGGRYGRHRILSEDTVRLMLHDYNSVLFPNDPHGLGWELGLNWYMGALSSPVTFGHTGYTGPSIAVDPLYRQFVVFCCNRVHPSRDWGSNNGSRRAMVDDLGLATVVRPATGRTAWFTRTDKESHGGKTDSTLTVPLDEPVDGGRLSYRFWYDTENRYDYVHLATSPDGTTYTDLPGQLRGGRWRWTTDGTVTGYGGRRWLSGDVELPAGTRSVRWTYRTDSNSQGRGVYVDAVRIRAGHHTVFDSDRRSDADRIVTDGWAPASR